MWCGALLFRNTSSHQYDYGTRLPKPKIDPPYMTPLPFASPVRYINSPLGRPERLNANPTSPVHRVLAAGSRWWRSVWRRTQTPYSLPRSWRLERRTGTWPPPSTAQSGVSVTRGSPPCMTHSSTEVFVTRTGGIAVRCLQTVTTEAKSQLQGRGSRGGGGQASCPDLPPQLGSCGDTAPSTLDCQCRSFLFLFVFARELGSLPK